MNIKQATETGTDSYISGVLAIVPKSLGIWDMCWFHIYDRSLYSAGVSEIQVSRPMSCISK